MDYTRENKLNEQNPKKVASSGFTGSADARRGFSGRVNPRGLTGATGSSPSTAPMEVQSVISMLQRRKEILGEVLLRIERIHENMVSLWNGGFNHFDNATQFQDSINALMDEIASLCAGLPRLNEAQEIDDSLDVIDASRLADLKRKIDLDFLGLGRRIDITLTYKSVATTSKDLFLSALTAASTEEKRQEAIEKITAFNEAISKFIPAIDCYAKSNIDRNLPPVPGWVSSATQLADEINKAAPRNTSDVITARDLDLLAGGEEGFADFLERLANVSPNSLNTLIVGTAIDIASTEASKMTDMLNAFEVARRNITVSDQGLADATDRLRNASASGQSIGEFMASKVGTPPQSSVADKAQAQADAVTDIELLR